MTNLWFYLIDSERKNVLSRPCKVVKNRVFKIKREITYVSLRLRVQNRRKKWNFPLNFRTMHKLSDLYSGIFETQSSGCASGVDLFSNFTKLKILNIWIVKYLLNCKRYLSYNFRIFQKISECWVLKNLDVHLERTTSELEFRNFQHAFLQFSEHTEFSTCFFTVFRTCWKFQHAFFIVLNTLFQYAFNMHYRFQHSLKFSTHFQTWKFETSRNIHEILVRTQYKC